MLDLILLLLAIAVIAYVIVRDPSWLRIAWRAIVKAYNTVVMMFVNWCDEIVKQLKDHNQ